jgi:hypothetical protein
VPVVVVVAVLRKIRNVQLQLAESLIILTFVSVSPVTERSDRVHVKAGVDFIDMFWS